MKVDNIEWTTTNSTDGIEVIPHNEDEGVEVKGIIKNDVIVNTEIKNVKVLKLNYYEVILTKTSDEVTKSYVNYVANTYKEIKFIVKTDNELFLFLKLPREWIYNGLLLNNKEPTSLHLYDYESNTLFIHIIPESDVILTIQIIPLIQILVNSSVIVLGTLTLYNVLKELIKIWKR